MATYVMQAEDGDTLEVDRPMSHPPQYIRRNGKTYKRVYTVPEAKISINPHFVSHSLPRATKDENGQLHSPYSKDVEPGTGKPRFSSWKGIREAEAFSKHNDQHRAVAYD